MGRLLRFEFRKLFRHISFYVCLAVSAGMIAAAVFSTKALGNLFGEDAVIEWTHFLGYFYSNAMLTILLGIFTALFISEDAAGGTFKNICSRGYSRTQIYFSKYIVSCVSVLIFCAVDMIAAVIIPIILGGQAGETTAMFVPDLAGAVVLLLAMNTLFFVISMLTGKSGMGIALNIVVPNLVSVLLPLADMYLNLETFSLGDYWLEDLLSAAAQAEDMKTLLAKIGLGIVWMVILTVVGVVLENRQEM